MLFTTLPSNAQGVGAANTQYLSVDLMTEGNEPHHVGEIESCAEVSQGEAFVADITVRDVSELVAWEFRLEFDSSVISIDSVDYDQFLLNNEAGITVSPKMMDVESSDRVFLGAGEARGNPDSGSGVLARIHLTALANGVSPLRISSQPTYLGPLLTNAVGDFVGDANGDHYWDAGITNGQVAVGKSCNQVTPIPTPPPPANGSTGGDTSGSDRGVIDAIASAVSATLGGDSANDSASSSAAVEVIGGDSSSGGVDGDNSSTGDGAADNGASDGSSAGGDDGRGGAGANPASSGDGIGGDNTVPLVLGVIALSSVVLGSAVLVLFRARRPGL